MSAPTASPVVRVQVVQALVARELVRGLGLPERKAAELLGLVPSSVSQYLSGKRLGTPLDRYRDDPDARAIARRSAARLVDGEPGPRVLLEAAIDLGELEHRTAPRRPPQRRAALSREVERQIPNWLRHRIAGEQAAVAECMRLAQRSRDELTRALFRQIASDSLRHAEIVASLAAYLDRGIAASPPSGITRSDVETLLDREHAAEATGGAALGESLGGMMRILWESMESDEAKHERLLRLLGDSDLPERARPRGRGRRAPRRR